MQPLLREVETDAEAFHALALSEGWSDGFPLIPPTEARIAALLAAVDRSPDEVLGRLEPLMGDASVTLIAANAVMAGVKPEAFPHLLAAVEAALRPEWRADIITRTTTAACPMMIVNGPSRETLGIDFREGCLGGATGRGSTSLGRALSLCFRNIGGQQIGVTSQSTHGQPGRLGLCFGEWEERSPWPSLARRRGFAPDEDVVTLYAGMGTISMSDMATDTAEDLALLMAQVLVDPMSVWYLVPDIEPGEVFLLLNPIWAERLSQAFARIDDLQAFLWDHAFLKFDDLPKGSREVLEKNGRVPADGPFRPMARPDQIEILVCGGLGGNHGTLLPSMVASHSQSVAVIRGRRFDGDLDRRIGDVVKQQNATMEEAGARFELAAVDAASARISLSLLIDDSACAECIVPTPMLEQIVAEAMTRELGRRFTVDIEKSIAGIPD